MLSLVPPISFQPKLEGTVIGYALGPKKSLSHQVVWKTKFSRSSKMYRQSPIMDKVVETHGNYQPFSLV